MWSPMKCSTLSWLRWGNAIINGQMAHVCRDLLLTHVRMISERAEDDQSEGWRKIWTDLQVPTPEPALNPHLPWCWVGQQWVCSIFYCYVNWLLRPTCNLNIYIGRFVVAAFYASLQVIHENWVQTPGSPAFPIYAGSETGWEMMLMCSSKSKLCCSKSKLCCSKSKLCCSKSKIQIHAFIILASLWKYHAASAMSWARAQDPRLTGEELGDNCSSALEI